MTLDLTPIERRIKAATEPRDMEEVRQGAGHYLEVADQCRDLSYEEIDASDPLELTVEASATIRAMHKVLEQCRTDLPACVEEIKRLRERVETLEKVRALLWAAGYESNAICVRNGAPDGVDESYFRALVGAIRDALDTTD